MSRTAARLSILLGMLLAASLVAGPVPAAAKGGRGADHSREHYTDDGGRHQRRDRSEPREDRSSSRNWEKDDDHRWQQLPEHERDRLRDRWQRFRELPPEQQEKLRSKYQRWQQLPPGEQERLQRTWRHYQELPSGQREQLKRELRSLHDLPTAERERRRQELHRSYFPDLPPPPPRGQR